MRARRLSIDTTEDNNSIKQILLMRQFEDTELTHKLRQFFIFEVCRDETIDSIGEFRCDTFSSRDKSEYYLIQDIKSHETIGYILTTKNLVSIGNGWHINEIMILPKYRRSGYGSTAIKNLIEKHPRDRFELCSAEGSAENFWQKMKDKFSGYEENGFIILNNK